MLMEFLLAVEQSALVRLIAATPNIYPVISALHIIGIALTFGSILPVDLRLLRLVGPQFDAVLSHLVTTALIGFALAASTGLLLASVRITEYLNNPAFIAKLLIVAAAGANALLLRLLSGSRDVPGIVGTRPALFAGTASMTLWLGAIFAGRWIAFAV